MRGGSRKSGGRDKETVGKAPAASRAQSPAPASVSTEPASATPEPASAAPAPASLDELYREFAAASQLRAQQEREVEDLRLLAGDIREQVRLNHHLLESRLQSEARALEQVDLLRTRVDSEVSPRVEALAAEVDESRRSFRKSSAAAASVVSRLETRLSDVARAGLAPLQDELQELHGSVHGRLDALDSRLEGLEALPARQAALETEFSTRLKALEDRLARQEVLVASGDVSDRVKTLEDRLDFQGSHVSLEDRLEEALRPLEARLASLASQVEEKAAEPAETPLRAEDLQQALDSLDLSGLVEPLELRLKVLAEELDRFRRKGGDPRVRERVDALEGQGIVTRLDRLEKEMRRHAERLDEELEAVFTQNRLRVAEMTDTFDDRMALLEAAAERVRELEASTVRSRAETGQVLQGAFERLEALTGKLGRLEDQVTLAPGTPAVAPEVLHELRGAVTHLQTRLQFLEGRPRVTAAALDPEESRLMAASARADEDASEGLVTADFEVLGIAAPAVPTLVQDVRARVLDSVERTYRDLEVRVLEQSLEALTESRLLREEYERMAGHLADMTDTLNQHFEKIWTRLGEAR